MSAAQQLFRVPFYEDTLAVVILGHYPFPFVDTRIILDSLELSESACPARSAQLIPLRKFPAWLASIDAAQVAPELQIKLARYRQECDAVLWEHWICLSDMKDAWQHIAASKRRLTGLLALYECTDEARRVELHRYVERQSRIMGLSIPAIEAIDRRNTPEEQAV